MSKKSKDNVISIKVLIRKLFIEEPGIDSHKLIEKVKEAFPWSSFNVSHVAYYRNAFRKEGLNIPMRQELSDSLRKKKKRKKKKNAEGNIQSKRKP